MELSDIFDILKRYLRDIKIQLHLGESTISGRHTTWCIIDSVNNPHVGTWVMDLDYYSQYRVDEIAAVIISVYYTDYEDQRDTTPSIMDALQYCFSNSDEVLESAMEHEFIAVTAQGEVYCTGVNIAKLVYSGERMVSEKYDFQPPRISGPAKILYFPVEHYFFPQVDETPRISSISYNLLKSAGKILDAVMNQVNFTKYTVVSQKDMAKDLNVSPSFVSEVCRMMVKLGILQQGKRVKGTNSYKLNEDVVSVKRDTVTA